MSIKGMYKGLKELKKLKVEADDFLKENVQSVPKVSEEYERWRKTHRINTVAVSAFVAKQICGLEKQDFNKAKRKIAYLGSAVAGISDDLIDRNLINPEKVYFLDRKMHRRNNLKGELGLFHIFHHELEKLIPNTFKNDFKEIISKFNFSQKQGRRLKGDLSKEDLIKIKDETGGYSFILLHRLMFPNNPDLPKNFNPNYSPEEMNMPKTKDHAFFNFGAMFSRIDDLDDLKYDKINGMKSLATERIITWNSLRRDIKYTKKGLKKFYSLKRVDSVMSFYSVNISHFISVIYNLFVTT